MSIGVVSDAVKAAIAEFAASHGGKVYAPVPHPDFAHMPSSHGPERFGMIEPHLREFAGGTALEIGSHCGFFAHKLEEMGYQVTAIESDENYALVLSSLRDAVGKSFNVITCSFFDLRSQKFDVVLAMNIFHHSLKRERTYKALVKFLNELDCKMMIFESHDRQESQMSNAFCNMGAADFAHFVAENAGLPKVELIGREANNRVMFKLSR